MGRAMRKRVIGNMRTAKSSSASASAQSDQGLRYLLTEALDTMKCTNGEQMLR